MKNAASRLAPRRSAPRRRLAPSLAVLALLAAGVPALAHADDGPDTVHDCHIGAYRLADERLMTIDSGAGDVLRWHRIDGQTGALHPGPDGVWASTAGWTDHKDGHTARFADCAAGSLTFDGMAAHRIDLDIADTTFQSDGLALAGRLVTPKGPGPFPVVILLHGSERYSGRDYYILQRLLPAHGIGVFVYDKRGTGQSAGTYTQDFSLLADDAVAAIAEARRLAGPRAGRVGFQGGSQGGYIGPLAATRTHADFVVSDFGLAVSPIEEDQEEIVLEMKLKGHSDADIAKALEIADAAATIIRSQFTEGFDRWDALQAQYRDAPWYKDLHGNFTVDFLPHTGAELKAKSADFLVGTPMDYDAMPVLRRLKTPQLWELGALDLDAPSAETVRRLKGLQAQGEPITIAVFPKAEHGVYEFETKPDGARVNVRNSDGYFAMMIDFIKTGRIHGTYGDSVIDLPRGAS